MSAMPKENEIPKCDSIEDVIRNFGDLQELAAEMDSYRELALSVESRRSELLSEYPDQWIAVSRDGVVAAAGTRDELFDLLAEKRVRREAGPPRGRISRLPGYQTADTPTVIHGWFDDQGRPYVCAAVTMPRLGYTRRVRLLVDTGTDVTALHPMDCQGIAYDLLGATSETTGIGGMSEY